MALSSAMLGVFVVALAIGTGVSNNKSIVAIVSYDLLAASSELLAFQLDFF